MKEMCQIRGFLEQPALPCTPSLLLPSLERGRVGCCLETAMLKKSAFARREKERLGPAHGREQ